MAIFLCTLLLTSVGTSYAKWTKEDCDSWRQRYPEGKEIDKDINYDFQCGWLKGATGGVPTGSLTLPEEHAEKYDTGIVARDPNTGEILGLIGLIIRLTNWALGFVGVVAMVAFVYGGYLMVANFGNDEMTGKGRKVLVGSSIGIIVILLSFTAVNALLRAGGGRPGDSGVGTEAEGVSRDYLEATLAGLQNTFFDIINDVGKIGDLCPYTPVGAKVNVIGCAKGESPPDTDGDGIINLFDSDDDNDGIPDKDDPDIDGDGVRNEQDFCPDTRLLTMASVDKDVRGLIENNLITLSEVRDGHYGDEEKGIPLIFPYVRPTSTLYPGSSTDTRQVGCASYEGQYDSDGDGYPNCLPGGPEELECGPNDFYVTHANDSNSRCDCDDDDDGVLDKNDPDIDGDGVFNKSSSFDTSFETRLFPELVGKFEREILVTCSRLPQTDAVKRLCDPNSGTLVKALADFLNNPSEEVMRVLLEQITILRNIVDNTPKVEAKIVAIPGKEGSAPFVVAFSGSSSVDPQGVSIPGENFEWCVGYTSIAESLNCPFDKKRIGPNISEIFRNAGVYAVQLRVETADKDSSGIKTAMDGYSTITIVVNPPSSNIRMEVKTVGEFVDATNLRSYEVLFGEASSTGVTFNVSKTTDYSGEGASNILTSRWDFGDGTITDSEDGLVSEVKHVYIKPGKYTVVFEVQDNRFNVSRKILELDVTDIVASLVILPASMKGDMTTQFTFDASDSKVEGGQIDSYFWRVVDTTDPENWIRIDSTEGNRNLIGPVVNYSFPRVGAYEVSVTVSTAARDRERSTSKNILILSRSPVARFHYRIADKKKPATVFLDASSSTDPDPNTDLKFTWTANGEPITLAGNEKVPMMGEYTFGKVGEHRIELVVTDDTGVTDKVSHIVKIDSTLDVDFTADRFSAYPDQEITFSGVSNSATGYFWDFGDTVRKYSETKTIKHPYAQAGSYTVTLTVDNLSGEENSISKRVRIGDKDIPIAAVRVLLNGLEIEPDERVCGTNEGILIDRLSTLTFDGSNSANTDGTSRGLMYSWNFDDGQKASSRSVVHKFEELTVGSDCYEVTLTVSDRVTGKTDTTFPVYIRVENNKPIAVSVDVIQLAEKVTPVTVPVNLIGAKDSDGRIIDYTWWYYDVQAPNKKIDTHVTTQPKTTFTIGPRAKEGIESTYHFAVEIRDNDGGKTLSEDILGKSQAFKVTNGPSLAPKVVYTVDKARVKVGEKISFTSATQDPLGRYIPTGNFKWDFYGDGRYDREIVGPKVTFSYDRPGTYSPRLKVTSDGISETYEMEIVVEAVTRKPEAAFLFIKTGNKITFINNSSVDPQLNISDLRYAWDFDIAVDSDGNGVKDDDVDSAQVNPSYIYNLDVERDVEVKLTVTDVMGQSDDVVRKVVTTKRDEMGALGATVQKKLIAVLETDPAPDALDKKTYLKSTNGQITFIMKRSTGKIKEYRLDLNVYEDSDGDGIADNDINNSLHESLDNGAPFKHTYPEDSKKIRAQLTVVDFQGGTDSAFVDVVLNESGLSPFESTFDPDSIFLVSGMAPVATFAIQDNVVFPRKAATFDASGSSFPEEKIREYRWDFNGDGEVDEVVFDSLVKYTYDKEGSYEVTLGIFSETDLYAEYSETILVRNLYSNPVADFSYEINDLIVQFNNLSTFDKNDPKNKLQFEWKFIPLKEDGEETDLETSLAEDIALTEEGSDNIVIVTNMFTPFSGRVTQPVVLQASRIRVSFEKDTELFDADDRLYERDITVPKLISAPKGTLDMERKIIDTFFIASAKPVFVTKNVVIDIDLGAYEGLKNPQIVFFDLNSKNWNLVEFEKQDALLTLNFSNLGIFALTDTRDAEVTKGVSKSGVFELKLVATETSTSESPVKTFDDHGSYNVVLTVTDVAGRKDSKMRVITLEPGVSGAFEPAIGEEIVSEIPAVSEMITEELVSEEPVITEEPQVVTTSQPIEKKQGGIGWFTIVLVIVFFLVVVGGVIFIINKIKDQLARSEDLMSGQVPGAPPGTVPTEPAPPVEVIEKKEGQKKEKEPEVSGKTSSFQDVTPRSKPPESSQVPKSETPSVVESKPAGGEPPAAPQGGEGPIPDWLKKK